MAIHDDYTVKISECINQITKLKNTVLSIINKFEWPIHLEKQEVILNKAQWNEVNETIDQINIAIGSLLPERSAIDIKPVLELADDSER
jgi:hypothetical protein